MPCKFGDIQKKAADVLNEDHQTKGFTIKSKQKTSWDGAVLTTACDLFSGKDEITTPGKVTWKFPKPAGFSGISIDKFEIDKKGGMKLEAVADSSLHKVKDLKVEFKSDLKDLAAISKGITFTGIKDTQIKAEVKPLDLKKFSAEVTRSVGDLATVGVNFGSAGVPDVALNVTKGPAFAAATAKAGFTVFNVYGMYAVNDKLKVAATFEQGGKKSGAFSAGAAFALQKGTSLKCKIDHEQNASATVKHEISKGVTILAGAGYAMKKSDLTYGLQVSVE
jgi:hypothetical protein